MKTAIDLNTVYLWEESHCMLIEDSSNILKHPKSQKHRDIDSQRHL